MTNFTALATSLRITAQLLVKYVKLIFQTVYETSLAQLIWRTVDKIPKENMQFMMAEFA
jgi:hypothetical protein